MNELTLQLLLVTTAMIMFLMSLVIAAIVPGMDRWSKHFFITFFTVLLLYGGVCLMEVVLASSPDNRLALIILCYIDSILSSILVPMLTAYLLHCCGDSLWGSRLFQLVTALWAGFFFLLNLAPFTTWVYYLLPDNRLGRGPLYPLVLGFLFVMALMTLVGVIRRRRHLAGKYYLAFLFCLVPITVAFFLHFFVSAFLLFDLGLAFCVFSMFILILSEQIDQNLRQQQEIARQRANVMILQMRPTLSTIPL